jgi:hypothetical protein
VTQELLAALAAHRRRLRLARAADTAVRWAFHAAVLAVVYAAASKLLGLNVPRSLAVTLLAAVPLGMAAREWARSFTIRDCALHLDRALGLEERLTTAVEAGDALGGAVAADASGALARAKPLPRRAPRELPLLAGSLLVLGVLLLVPAPERSGSKGDPVFEKVSDDEAARLESLAGVDVEFKEVAEELRRGRAEEALARLEALRDRLEAKLLAEGSAAAEARKALDAAGASAQALGAQLARLGRTVHAPPPAAVDAKLARQAVPSAAAEELPAGLGRAAVAHLSHADWDPRYDAVIRRFYGSRKP